MSSKAYEDLESGVPSRQDAVIKSYQEVPYPLSVTFAIAMPGEAAYISYEYL